MDQLTSVSQPIELENVQTVPAKKRPPVRSIVTGSILAIGFLLLKLKGVVFLAGTKFKLLLVNPFEGFGVAQFAMAGVSMIVTIVAYAIKMGLIFAAGFVLLTVIHEIGHAVMIRAKGLRAGGMVFIPFVGGAVTLKDQPRSAFDDAQIALAGPIAGTLAALACLSIYHFSGYVLYLALAFAGFLLNLFNLMPVGPLDGGRIAGAISKWMWVLGGIILFFVMIAWRSPLLVLVLLLALWQVYRAIRDEQANASFYDVTLRQRTGVALVYFGLVAFLGWTTVATHAELLTYRL